MPIKSTREEVVKAQKARRAAPAGTGVLPGQEGLASPSYRAYQPLRLLGQWAVLADKIAEGSMDFYQDPHAPQGVPWKVTDAIRWILFNCGVPDYEIDVPDDPLRLFPTANPSLDQDRLIIRPGTQLSHVLEELCLHFMGRVLVRDPNAGPSGMWRLLPPQPTEVLCNFYMKSQAGYLAADPAAYPNGTFATRFRSWVKAPDFNMLIVTGTGDIDIQTRGQLKAWKWNPLSFNWPGGPATANPNSPDYTDGTRRVAILNHPQLVVSQEAANFLCARIFDLAGHGEQWVGWTAPLMLIRNPADPLQRLLRPLRINDMVTFPELGINVIVRNCNPIYAHDAYQMADYEGKVQ